MGVKDVLQYQEQLIQEHRYQSLEPEVRGRARAFYAENVPEGFSMDGDDRSLFSPGGLKIAEGYHRVVVGDYGAFVEILPEQIVHENIRVKKGQEYRDEDARYAKHTKYSWLTAKDGSDIKITFQKKPVGYADYVPGRYYVSVFECVPSKVIDKDGRSAAIRQDVEDWLKKYGVFNTELASYYCGLAAVHGDVINYAITHQMPPYELDYWLKLVDVCQLPEGLSFLQYEAISYNLAVIDCSSNELQGTLESLDTPVRTAIEMGLEGLEFPYEIQTLSSSAIREILSLSAMDAMQVSKFSKIVAGHKSDGLDGLIAQAKNCAEAPIERSAEFIHALV